MRSLTFYTVPSQYATALVALRDIPSKIRVSKAGVCDADGIADVVGVDGEHLALLLVGRVVIEVEGLWREIAQQVVVVL